MTRRLCPLLLLLLTGCVCDRPAATAAGAAAVEPPVVHFTSRERLDAEPFHPQVHRWLDMVRRARGAIFVRNGMDYGGDQVADCLQRKWELKHAQIHSAEDFLRLVATRSETSGQVYQVLLPDGRMVPLVTWLRSARHS